MTSQSSTPANPSSPKLKRALPLPLVVLYGLGVTVGAGIYVLIGATAGAAGMHAPFAFVLASVVMFFSAASFAELCVRMPVSAGEAAYVQKGFNSHSLSLLTGLLVVSAGIVSSATVALGSAGYIRHFVDVPAGVLTVLVLVGLGAISAVGIVQSVTVAAVLTLVEVAGLVAIVAGGFVSDADLLAKLPTVFPGITDAAAWSGVFAAGLFAFFAFIGFEDMVNIAEEVKEPQTNMPLAIFLTLALTSVIYFLVAAVSILSVPPVELASSEAPLGLVFLAVTSLPPGLISAIAVLATLNGIMIQIIMASRVIYGLASQGRLPAVFAQVNAVTRTPLVATAVVTGLNLLFAALLPLELLAQMTSRITLVVFTLVCLALLRIKLTEDRPPEGLFTVPIWVPAIAVVANILFLYFGS